MVGHRTTLHSFWTIWVQSPKKSQQLLQYHLPISSPRAHNRIWHCTTKHTQNRATPVMSETSYEINMTRIQSIVVKCSAVSFLTCVATPTARALWSSLRWRRSRSGWEVAPWLHSIRARPSRAKAHWIWQNFIVTQQYRHMLSGAELDPRKVQNEVLWM